MDIFTLVGKIALSGMDTAQKQLEGLEGFAKKNEKTFKAVGAVVTGVGVAITGALTFATKAALDQQIGISRLDTTLRNTGKSYASLKDEIEDAITATERKTNYSDNEQRDALTKLIFVTGTYEGALQQLQIATNLAAINNMDLVSAATLVGRVATGASVELSRYGVTVDANATATEKLAAMQNQLSNAAVGAANPLTIMANQIKNLAEDIGSVLVPILKSAVDFIKPVITQVRDWIKANPDLTKGIVVLGGILGILMGTVIGPLLIVLPQLASAFVIVKKAILGIRLVTIEYTILALALVAGLYAIRTGIGMLRGDIAATGNPFADMFTMAKKDIGDLISKLGELLPASDAAIQEATTNAKEGFKDEKEAIDSTTQALDEFNQKANEVRDAERRLAMTFVDLWQGLTYADTKAGKFNLTMDDVYEALYKTGHGIEDIGKTFEKYQLRQDAVNQVLAEYGLTAEGVAKLVGKLTEATDKQTEALTKQSDAAKQAANAFAGVINLGPAGLTPAGGGTTAYNPSAQPGQAGYIGAGGVSYPGLPLGTSPGTFVGTGLYGFQHGGMIEEPTLLTRLKDLKPYAVAGEAGPEPVGFRGVTITGNTFVVRRESDIDKIAEALIDKIRLKTGVKI